MSAVAAPPPRRGFMGRLLRQKQPPSAAFHSQPMDTVYFSRPRDIAIPPSPISSRSRATSVSSDYPSVLSTSTRPSTQSSTSRSTDKYAASPPCPPSMYAAYPVQSPAHQHSGHETKVLQEKDANGLPGRVNDPSSLSVASSRAHARAKTWSVASSSSGKRSFHSAGTIASTRKTAEFSPELMTARRGTKLVGTVVTRTAAAPRDSSPHGSQGFVDNSQFSQRILSPRKMEEHLTGTTTTTTSLQPRPSYDALRTSSDGGRRSLEPARPRTRTTSSPRDNDEEGVRPLPAYPVQSASNSPPLSGHSGSKDYDYGRSSEASFMPAPSITSHTKKSQPPPTPSPQPAKLTKKGSFLSRNTPFSTSPRKKSIPDPDAKLQKTPFFMPKAEPVQTRKTPKPVPTALSVSMSGFNMVPLALPAPSSNPPIESPAPPQKSEMPYRDVFQSQDAPDGSIFQRIIPEPPLSPPYTPPRAHRESRPPPTPDTPVFSQPESNARNASKASKIMGEPVGLQMVGPRDQRVRLLPVPDYQRRYEQELRPASRTGISYSEGASMRHPNDTERSRRPTAAENVPVSPKVFRRASVSVSSLTALLPRKEQGRDSPATAQHVVSILNGLGPSRPTQSPLEPYFPITFRSSSPTMSRTSSHPSSIDRDRRRNNGSQSPPGPRALRAPTPSRQPSYNSLRRPTAGETDCSDVSSQPSQTSSSQRTRSCPVSDTPTFGFLDADESVNKENQKVDVRLPGQSVPGQPQGWWEEPEEPTHVVAAVRATKLTRSSSAKASRALAVQQDNPEEHQRPMRPSSPFDSLQVLTSRPLPIPEFVRKLPFRGGGHNYSKSRTMDDEEVERKGDPSFDEHRARQGSDWNGQWNQDEMVVISKLRNLR